MSLGLSLNLGSRISTNQRRTERTLLCFSFLKKEALQGACPLFYIGTRRTTATKTKQNTTKRIKTSAPPVSLFFLTLFLTFNPTTKQRRWWASLQLYLDHLLPQTSNTRHRNVPNLAETRRGREKQNKTPVFFFLLLLFFFFVSLRLLHDSGLSEDPKNGKETTKTAKNTID